MIINSLLRLKLAVFIILILIFIEPLFAREVVLDNLKYNLDKPAKGEATLLGTTSNLPKLENIPETGDDELLQIRSDRLAELLDKVSPDEKAILIMMYAYEWKMDEIAEKMDISLSAVKMLLKRAKAKNVILL